MRKHKSEFEKSSNNGEDCCDADADANNGNQQRENSSRKSNAVAVQPTIRSVLKRKDPYPASHPRKMCADEKLVKLITARYLPFSLVDYHEFIEYSNELNPQYIPSNRKIFTTVMLPKMYSDMKNKLICILRDTHVSLTADAWTSAAVESFLSLTCHFIFMNELKRVILDTPLLKNGHSAPILKETIETILVDFGIEKRNVVSLTTDNEATMVCLGKDIGIPWFGCYCRLINLVMNDIFHPTSAQKAKEKSNSNVYELLQPIIELIQNVKKIVTFFHSSTLAAEALKREQSASDGENELILVQECDTRWNSMYLMLERFHKLSTAVACVLIQMKTSLPTFTYADIQLMSKVITLLRPFKLATDKLSGSKYVTISMIIPTTN